MGSSLFLPRLYIWKNKTPFFDLHESDWQRQNIHLHSFMGLVERVTLTFVKPIFVGSKCYVNFLEIFLEGYFYHKKNEMGKLFWFQKKWKEFKIWNKEPSYPYVCNENFLGRWKGGGLQLLGVLLGEQTTPKNCIKFR